MAESNTALDGKSSINVKWLTMWDQISDDSSKTVYDDTPYKFENQLNSAKYAPRMQTNEQYGDGIKVEDYIAKDGGDLEIVIRGFKPGDSVYLFGEKMKNGIEVSNSDDIVPYKCVAYATERPDGRLNLYKFPKAKFKPEGEDSQQRQGSQVNYGTAQLKGTYSPLLSSHDDCFKKYGVDPVKDKAIIDEWFSTPEPTLDDTPEEDNTDDTENGE